MNLKTIATFATAVTLAASGLAHAQTEGNDGNRKNADTPVKVAVSHTWIAPAQDHTVRVEAGKSGKRPISTVGMFPRVQM